MARTQVNTRGLASFTSTLTTDKLDFLIEGGLAANAKALVREAAIIILDLAYQICTVDTGRLQGSLRQGDDENIWIEEKGGFLIRFGTKVFYAVYVEFGTRYQHAQPFLGMAVEHYRPEWHQAIVGIFKVGGHQVRGI